MPFHARNSFCSRLTSAICLYAQVQFHAKDPLIGSQSDREFTFSYAILNNKYKIYKLKACLKTNVFRWHLKLESKLRLGILQGRLFQMFGLHNKMFFLQV